MSYAPAATKMRRKSSDQAVTNSMTAVACTGMVFPVKLGKSYWFRFFIVCRTDNTACGIRTCLTVPAFTTFHAHVVVPSTAVTSYLSGEIRSSGGVVDGSGFPTSNENYAATLEGTITPSADGSVQFCFACNRPLDKCRCPRSCRCPRYPASRTSGPRAPDSRRPCR